MPTTCALTVAEDAIGSLEPGLSLLDVMSMRALLRRRARGARTVSPMFELLGLAALFLACVGIDGGVWGGFAVHPDGTRLAYASVRTWRRVALVEHVLAKVAGT